MRFNLPLMASVEARKGRRNTDAIVFRGFGVTQSIAAELRALVIQPVNYWGTAAREEIIPLYVREMEADASFRDSAADELRAQINRTAEGALRLSVSLSTSVVAWSVRVQEWHAGRWVDGIKTSTGIDIAGMIGGLGAEAEVIALQEWASGLIVSVNDDIRRRIETATFKAVASQPPRRVLANEIADAMRIGRARAKFIAEDQANKLSGKLDELRHA